MSEKTTSQVALPPVPLPQFADEDFTKGNLGLINTTIASIVKQINALSPMNPRVNLRAQFLCQFLEEDFHDETLGFVNQQFTQIVKNVNALSASDGTEVKPVALVQLKPEDFKKPGMPVVSQYVTSIIDRLNAVR